MKPDELIQIRQAAKLGNILPTIEENVTAMSRTVHVRAFELIRKGKLTGEEAISMWMELHAYDRLMKRFQQQIAVGTTTAEEHLTKENTNG